MSRSSSRKSFAPRKQITAQGIIAQSSKGAIKLLASLEDQGFDLDVTQVPRTGSKGNLIKTDIENYLKTLSAIENDPESISNQNNNNNG